MTGKNDHKHYSEVTVLRTDGTPWVIPHVKHVISRPHDYALYLGEHGTDRETILIPYGRVDHLRIKEQRE